MRSILLCSIAGLAAAGSVTAQAFVMMKNAATNSICTFSPVDGSLISSTFIPVTASTQVSAIDVNGEIWLSAQTLNTVTRYDSAGNLLGTIGPTFPGGGLSNIRGMAFLNGVVYVTNSGTANGAPGNAVQAFDTSGNFLFSFTTQGTATSPFSVLAFQGNLLVAGSSNADDVHRFTPAGADLGTFHNSASISFAHQLALASDGNVWCGCFTTGGVTKLDATTGAVLTSFPAAGARGVYELLNGNILWTNSSGSWVYDFGTATSTLVLAGSSYHLNPYGNGPTASAAGYGTGCDGLWLSTNGLPSIGNAGFELRVNNVPVVSPIGFVAFGSVALNPGVDLTFLGMQGCFAHTSFDIGLFTGGFVVGGTSTLPLPIPSSASLAGASLAAQGVSLSAATAFGLATSDGMQLVIN